MSLREVARQTLAILSEESYCPQGAAPVSLKGLLAASVEGTRVFTPHELTELLAQRTTVQGDRPARVVVSGESTQVAARRLVEQEGRSDLVLLNFASAKNVCGGFLTGAKAQEEDLARASGLHPCLQTASNYYAANRACGHLLYTDHMVWSPSVPFFRGEGQVLLPRPFTASVLTAPAPNALALARAWPEELAGSSYEDVLRRRIGLILALAQERRHRHLLLGAWGCGVFRNEPELVADAFGRWLEHPRFLGAFEQVDFAIFGRPARNREAFVARFGGEHPGGARPRR